MTRTLVIAHTLRQAKDYIESIDSGDTEYIPVTPYTYLAGVSWNTAILVDFILDKETINWFTEAILWRYHG